MWTFRDAIASGIFNDMGSGSNVDLVVIKANDNVSYLVTNMPRSATKTRNLLCGPSESPLRAE